MNGHEKSHHPVVPANPSNEAASGGPAEERGEGGGLDQGESARVQQSLDAVPEHRLPHALERIHQAARKDKKARFTALLHHIYDIERLRAAYAGLNRQAVPGVDKETWESYGRDLEANLKDLSGRLARGAYRAKPVRRAFIPKPDGGQRPLGIPALEDKIVQSATAEVLSAIYEADFLGFSYGFRRGRGPIQALDALYVALVGEKVNWVLDADIRGFFDAIDHECLLKFLEHRIADKRVLRLIRKWLEAGVLEDDTWRPTEVGTPQGGSISPLLANVYLHYVFDLWVHDWRQAQARGRVIVVRYADDCAPRKRGREVHLTP